jgi:cytochrome subunit of sulfide dehydrogenase
MINIFSTGEIMKKQLWVLAFVLGASVPLAHAQSAEQVRSWAAACANCHGTDGRAQSGMESLAGADKDDMIKKMLDFKAGRKPATIMHQLAKGYTDEQIAAIAGYFAAQKK